MQVELLWKQRRPSWQGQLKLPLATAATTAAIACLLLLR
jgi:hypothetical protein